MQTTPVDVAPAVRIRSKRPGATSGGNRLSRIAQVARSPIDRNSTTRENGPKKETPPRSISGGVSVSGGGVALRHAAHQTSRAMTAASVTSARMFATCSRLKRERSAALPH